MEKIIKILLLFVVIVGCSQETEVVERKTQIADTGKIKVYLLGTFHFALTDSTYNVMDAKHQNSIEELCDIIARTKAEKIFTERQPEYEFQNKIDSLYTNYLATEKLISKNEIFQVGFRAAKKMGHQRVYQCDHPGQHGRLLSIAEEYASENGQTDILEASRKGTVKRHDNIVNEDSIMQNTTLLEYMQWVNSEQVMKTSHAFYIANYTQVGSTGFYDYDDDFTLVGAEITSNWYHRNIMIYSKMINQLDYNEEAIFLLIGGDHVPIISNLFEANPYFEVVKTSEWLKK